MVFVGAILLIAVIAYWVHRYISDPLARAAARKALQENPWQWAVLIVAIGIYSVRLVHCGVWTMSDRRRCNATGSLFVSRHALTAAGFDVAAQLVGLARRQGTDFDAVIAALIAVVDEPNDGVAAG